jgi:flagellar motor protein MotB
MAKACKKCKPTECEECPEWIFTFADLVMLMMGFFVILWVLKPAPGEPGKPQQELPIEVLAAIREAFDYVPDPSSKDPVDVHMLLKKLEQMKPLKGPGDGGKTKLERKGVQGTDPEVEMVRPSKQVGTGAKVLFAQADATLPPESKRALDDIANIIRGHRNIFIIKGHASSDDYPDSPDDRPRMELSIRRAQAAADHLAFRGVDRETLRIQGCSTFEPLVQRAWTTDAKAQNRRVEVIATGTLVEQLQDPAKSTTGPASAPSSSSKPKADAHD